MTSAVRLSRSDTALVSTIYNPPRARQPWPLSAVLPEGTIRFYSLGRWALVDALQACGVGQGDRVLVPGLICREVLASLNVIGAVAAFYPVSSDLRACITGDEGSAKAVVAVNYFGFPQDLHTCRAYCRRVGASLIEDNAHGLFSRDDDGAWLGSRGDAGLFSFRKTLAVAGGGAAVLQGGRTLPGTAEASARRSECRYRLKQGFRRIVGPLGPRRVHRAIGAFRQVRRAFTGAALPSGGPHAETRIPMPSGPSVAILRDLAVAEPALEVQRRRMLFELAGQIVDRSSIGAIPVFRNLPRNAVPYGFPFFAPPAAAPAIAAEFGQYGFPVAQWPDLPAAVAPSAPEHYRHLMVVPFLW